MVRDYTKLLAQKARLKELTTNNFYMTPQRREYEREKRRERGHKLRRRLDAYKVSKGCIDCGYNKHAAPLHFDHITGTKELCVSKAWNFEKAMEEAKKCVIRCANCHAIRHFEIDQQVQKELKEERTLNAVDCART
jgi:hypothetical protein